VLGVDPASVEVNLGEAASDTLVALRRATEDRRRVALDYYSYGRDELTSRVVHPYRVYADQGQWYLQAHCEASEGERIFRLDRVRAARVLEDGFEPPDDLVGLGVFRPTPETPRVTIELGRDARWVTDQYPVEAIEERTDGGVRIALAISARPWLERLLLRLGPAAQVVDGPDELRSAGAEAAARVLARYTRTQA
jgi:proteasome accessory factor C